MQPLFFGMIKPGKSTPALSGRVLDSGLLKPLGISGATVGIYTGIWGGSVRMTTTSSFVGDFEFLLLDGLLEPAKTYYLGVSAAGYTQVQPDPSQLGRTPFTHTGISQRINLYMESREPIDPPIDPPGEIMRTVTFNITTTTAYSSFKLKRSTDLAWPGESLIIVNGKGRGSIEVSSDVTSVEVGLFLGGSLPGMSKIVRLSTQTVYNVTF